MADLRLELYIAGQSRNSQTALTNLRRLCDHEFAGRCDVLVVDVLEDPEAAESANVLATPTLIKRAPPPLRRIVGDLSQTQVVLRGLDFHGDRDMTEGSVTNEP
jgi:circadian clock protein KaiB